MSNKTQPILRLHLFAISGTATIQRGKIVPIEPSKVHIILGDELPQEYRRFIFENILNGNVKNMSYIAFIYMVDYLSSVKFFKGDDVLCSPFSTSPDQLCIRPNARFIGCIFRDSELGGSLYFIDGPAESSKMYKTNKKFFAERNLLPVIAEIKRKKGFAISSF